MAGVSSTASPATALPSAAVASLVDWLPYALLAAGALLLIVVAAGILMARAGGRAWLARALSRSPALRPPRAPAPRPSPTEELHQIAAAMAAELDAKAARLESLIAAADHRLAALQAATHQTHSTHSTHPSPAPHPRQPEPYSSRAPDRAHAAAHASAHIPHDADAMDHSSREICRLADAGSSPVQIARELGQGIGTVELVLALRRR